MIDRLTKRILFGVGIGRVSAASDETGPTQSLQLEHRTGETHDSVLSAQLYGFASVPQIGCDKVVIYAEGDRTKGVCIASNDQRFRPRNMAAGESQVHDSIGQQVYLKSDGSIQLVGKHQIVASADTSITLKVGSVTMTLDSGGLHVTGGPITCDHNITAGEGTGDQVDMQGHEHSYLPGGGSATTTSPPIAGT